MSLLFPTPVCRVFPTPGKISSGWLPRQISRTIVIPGPSAAISALCISGLFHLAVLFRGFLSTNRKNRREHLQSLIGDTHTLIFYEAPHKLLDTLKDMAAAFGADRRISLCREMTKIHEQVFSYHAARGLSSTTPKIRPKVSLS